MTYIAAYPSFASLPAKDVLTEKARSVVKTYPLLKARIIDPRTTKPKWGLLSDVQVDRGLEALVRDIRLEDVDDLRLGPSEKNGPKLSRYLEAIFTAELQDKQPLRVCSNGLLWRVVRYYRKCDAALQTDSHAAFVALTCNHVISDGTSGQALLGALLSGTEPDYKEAGPGLAMPGSFPPSMQSTLNCRPSLGFILHQIWYELVVPTLPRAIQSICELKSCWPATPPKPIKCMDEGDAQAFDHVHLTMDRLQRLKHHGKRNGIMTLHPTLQIAAAVALWIVVGNGSDKGTLAHKQALELAHASPISYRQTSLGHSPISGNYIGQIETHTTATDKLLFWQTVQQYASWLHSPAGRRRGLQLIGSLRYIPDGENKGDVNSVAPTGWESFFLERSQRVPLESFSVSNLGYSERPPGSIAMAWSQTPSLLQPPAFINIIGHEGGIDITVSRLACVWADADGYDPREHLATMYQKVLEALADMAEDDVAGNGAAGLTFGTIRALAQAE